MSKPSSFIGRFFYSIWKTIDLTGRTFFGLIALFFVIVLLVGVFSGSDETKVPKGAALILAPEGVIVEQKTYVDPVSKVIGDLQQNGGVPETSVYDVIDAIENAKEDKRISVLLINTNSLVSAGLTKQQDIAAALADFKTSGKKVIAIGDFFGQTQYYLAAQADEIYMNPYGGVLLEGLSRNRTYFKSAIDKLGVNVHVFRVGTFKSAVEPFIRDDMSAAAKESNRQWLGDLWDHMKADIASARDMSVPQLEGYINEFPERLEATGGDTAQLALQAGMVDSLKDRAAIRDMLIEMVGEDEQLKSFRQIHYRDYLKAIRPGVELPSEKDKVAVIVAKGEILDGQHKEGMIGGDTVAALIRKARLDDNVKAIVMRVDSPGGSAFASEIIRSELVKAQEQGLPVIASMASVAASGGYWISASADEIWAYPTTITGSIGIFGMFPTIEEPLDKLGIHRDGVGTTPMAGAFDFGKPLPPEVAQIIQSGIENGYQRFLNLVADGRGMSIEQVDEIAQGRVWSGEDAHELGLVDGLGDLDDAVQAAAKRAGLDDYDVRFVSRDLSEQELLMKQLFGSKTATEILGSGSEAYKPSPVMRLVNELSRSLNVVLSLNDPNSAYVLCELCEVN